MRFIAVIIVLLANTSCTKDYVNVNIIHNFIAKQLSNLIQISPLQGHPIFVLYFKDTPEFVVLQLNIGLLVFARIYSKPHICGCIDLG